MKTLDEVINSMEACVHEKCYYESDCAYSYLAFGEISCVTKAIPAMMTDALQYLKQFRDYQNSAEMKINPACVSGVENEPLSWDELKQMKGKPVLVEADEGKYKRWFIVGNFFSWFEKEDFDAHVNLYDCNGAMEFCKETYGGWWQAYLKERE